MPYTQTDRPMRVETVLGEDVLLLSGFSGTEGVSTPFGFDIELLSEDPAIAGEDLLRKPVVLTLVLPDGTDRRIHGLISRFVQLGRSDDLTAYRARVVPWLWFLSLSRDCKIFQNMSVLEIIEAVFQSQGYSDFQFKCVRPYPKREYCVQYRETHLDFISRLMEEEGIFYFFDHTASKHTLVLADDNSAFELSPGPPYARMATRALPGEDVVTSLQREHAVHVGTVTLTDYDHLQPSLRLRASIAGNEPEEVYDYPGSYSELDEGERYARIQLEAEEALHHVVRGQGSCRGFVSGGRFDLKDHYRADANRSYVLLSVRHSGTAGDYRSHDAAPFDYANEFVAIPFDVAYRPQSRTPRPVVRGSQTALVVGKSGEEIYVDDHGRVKVQFYWDRDGKRDENSSCWVRVSTVWAGKAWGAIQIPRMGQEVIVDFLEGNPDRPIITGRVYNAEQVPPYELPANQTQSGIKSRSSKGGGPDNFNEIRMEDKKGSELLYFHAEKDKQVVVENDRSESVGNDEKISIGRNRDESVGKNESISIGENQSLSVGGNQSISVGGNRSENVGKNESLSVGGNRSDSIAKNESVDIGGDRSESVGKKESISVGDSRTAQIGKDDQLRVGKKLIIDAGDQIVLKSGKASIVMKKDGTITIKGKDINLSGSGKINAKASSDVTIKGSKIKQN
jgi:type VI secretion system secreted protein VgrG